MHSDAASSPKDGAVELSRLFRAEGCRTSKDLFSHLSTLPGQVQDLGLLLLMEGGGKRAFSHSSRLLSHADAPLRK